MGESPGLFAALKHLGAVALGVVQTRLALLANEVAEERLRVTSLIATALAATVFLTVALLLAVGLLLLVFWEQRLWVLTGATLSCVAIGVALLRSAQKQAGRPSGLFAASLAELQTDRERLSPDAADSRS